MEQQERYYLEQRLIPEILYSEECSRFIMVLLQDRGKFFVNVLNTIGKESGYQCPYKPEQFVFKPQILSGEDKSQDIAFLFIDMPEPESVPLCSRIIICHDAAISNPRYYTVEKSVGDSQFMLCGVDEEGAHLNFGSCPESEEELFYRVHGLYTKHLAKNRRVRTAGRRYHMGTGYEATCSKCTYHAEFFLGSGMLFPDTYKSVQKDIRNGKYGEEWKAFLADNPGAVFNAERELYRCRKCNQLLVDYNLSLYVSEDGQPPEHGYWAVWGYQGKKYKFVKRYIHKCPKCSSRMVKQDPHDSAIPCPECGANLLIEGGILWD